MQLARTTVVVQAIGRIRLLLRLHNDRAGAERVHGASGNVDHLSGKYVDPVQQLFGALLLDCLGKRLLRSSCLESQGDLSARLGMGHVPAFVLATGFSSAT